MHNDVLLCTYGDVMRVPASHRRSLLSAKSKGADIRMVYSAEDALALARNHPDKEVVFLAIGFETTTPPTALVILQARNESLQNFSVLCNHVLTPSAITHIFARTYNKPVVISGFEPLDVLLSILLLVQQVNDGRAEVENQFSRAVNLTGNRIAQDMMHKVLELRDKWCHQKVPVLHIIPTGAFVT